MSNPRENKVEDLDKIIQEMLDKRYELSVHHNKFKKTNRSDLKEYLEAILNPKTSGQWTLALTDPNSPQYKLLMQLIDESIADEVLLIKLLHHWIQVMATEEKKKKEDEFKEHIAVSNLIETKLHDCLLRLSASIIQKIENNTHIEQLKGLASTLPEKIDLLKDETKMIQANISHLEHKKTILNKNWRKRCQEFDDILINELTNQKKLEPDLKIYAVVNSEIQEIPINQFANMIKSAPAPITFEEKLQHNPELRNKLLKLWKESQTTTRTAAKMENVIDQFTKFGWMCGDNYPMMTKLINMNKSLNKVMGEVSNRKTDLNVHDIQDLFQITETLNSEHVKLDTSSNMINEMTKLFKTVQTRVENLDKMPGSLPDSN